MKIFVTGSSGFVGSNLTPLLAQDHQVYSMVSDLLDFDSVCNEIIKVNPDIVVHLAARTEVEHSFYEQVTFSQINYVGTVNLIESAKACKNLKNFIFASTMEVYGWQPISQEIITHGHPQHWVAFDEHTMPAPNAPYAVAKYACEKYLEYVSRSQDFPFTAVRQTNCYGRRDNDFFVTEQIISQMLTNPHQIRLGYSEPYRNFLFVDDLITAWLAIVNNPDASRGKIFTLGPDNAIKIKNYADIIAKKIGWSGNIIWHSKPKRHGEIYWLNSNHTLIESTLGWKPSVTMDQGLDRTIEIWKHKLFR